jgi:hypothetical protein
MLGAVQGMAAGLPGIGDLSLQQGLLGPASPIPTQCLLLKNMFDASMQSEPEWEKEVAEDVKDECSKFGAVLHVHVDKNSQVGSICAAQALQLRCGMRKWARHALW